MDVDVGNNDDFAKVVPLASKPCWPEYTLTNHALNPMKRITQRMSSGLCMLGVLLEEDVMVHRPSRERSDWGVCHCLSTEHQCTSNIWSPIVTL